MRLNFKFRLLTRGRKTKTMYQYASMSIFCFQRYNLYWLVFKKEKVEDSSIVCNIILIEYGLVMSSGFFCDVYFALLHRQERKAAVYSEVKEKTVHDLSVRKFLETTASVRRP